MRPEPMRPEPMRPEQMRQEQMRPDNGPQLDQAWLDRTLNDGQKKPQ